MRSNSKPNRSTCVATGLALATPMLPEDEFDQAAWEMLSNWKQRHGDRFGAGTPIPEIPQSQRQYDGDNHFDYCEVLVLR